MALPVSPNAISLNQVNTELGLTATATISMNDAAVRTLAGVGGSGTTISMSNLHGKSNYINVNTYSFTGSDQSFTVPSSITTIKVRVWGAGGGSGFVGPTGGLGGYSEAIFSTSPGTVFTVVVGRGGLYANVSSQQYGGGGYGRNGGTAHGGGYSRVYSSGRDIWAGGGGGGGDANNGYTSGSAGNGGGANSSGNSATSSTNGTIYFGAGGGGTTSAGGSAGTADLEIVVNATAGSFAQGGFGDSYASGGGGGGGGYYGGGGGGGPGGAGGGGSGYVLNGTSIVGYNSNYNGPDYPGGGVGAGGASHSNAGGHGYVAIRW
jgi:hypothetical protein